MLYLLRMAFFMSVVTVGTGSAAAWVWPEAPHKAPARVILAKKKEKKKGKRAAPSAPPPAATKMQELNLDSPPAANPNNTIMAPALDLSSPPPAAMDEKAKREILAPPPPDDAGGKKSKKGKGGGIDFGGAMEGGAGGDAGGGMTFDFGGDQPFNLGNLNVQSAERQRFENAVSSMSDEDYEKAALEFKVFLTDNAFAEFQEESQYQLGKALYKMDYYEGALKQYQTILEKGPTHRRYRKAVEWLFFMSRKLADQTPVLAQLARYRNVTFPKAYRNEYNYLLAKYLFVQADNFEVKRLQEDDVSRGKKSKENTLDFSAIADAITSPQNEAMDFTTVGGAGALDFSAGGAGMDFSGTSSSGGGMDFGAAPAGGGSMDFGAPPPAAGGMDFGAPPAAGGGGGLDFGAPPPPAGSGPAAATAQPTAAPTNAVEAVKQGLELIDQVTAESTFYPRAKYLSGLLHYLGNEDQKAVEAFQEVVRVLNPREGARLDPKLREMAFLSLARIHYGYKQFNRSAYYYDLIDRDSDNWLTALFEASWAYYRRGDFEKALGNLLTLHSPFFEREYFPESQIVKAIIYFEACRYPETRNIVDDFIKRFTQLMREMQKIAESKEAPEQLNDRIAALQASTQQEQDDVAARVLNLTLSSPEIRQANAVVKQVEAQKKKLAAMDEKWRNSALGNDLAQQLRDVGLERARDAGEVTRKKFEQELYKLKSLLAQALRIKIEVARAEREVLERKMQGQPPTDDLVQATARTVVDDEHVYWPYEGEYWRDELGTYELDFSMCKQLAQQ